MTLTRALSELGHRDRGCRRRPVCPKGEGPASDGRWQDLIVSAVHEGIAKAIWTSKRSRQAWRPWRSRAWKGL